MSSAEKQKTQSALFGGSVVGRRQQYHRKAHSFACESNPNTFHKLTIVEKQTEMAFSPEVGSPPLTARNATEDGLLMTEA